MSDAEFLTDLVCLVADKDIEQSMTSILERHHPLRIREIKFDIKVHPERDPGCRLRSPDFLRSFSRQARRALVVFDREGCGKDDLPREEIESELEGHLSRSGWGDRSAVIVVDPEIEAWLWSESPHVDTALGWSGRSPDLRAWMRDHEWLESSQSKPVRPKEAFEAALRTVRKPKSAAIFREVGRKVSITKCVDPAFVKLRETLQRWFAMGPP